MTSDPGKPKLSRSATRSFRTTRWSLAVAAGRPSSPEARDALEVLCQRYWYPLYAYIRRRGFGVAEAQDLTQGFFTRLLEKNYLADVKRGQGKFRSFLLASVNHFLANDWDREHAKKRFPGEALLSLDLESAESRYVREPGDERTPERVFEKRWALAVLEQASRSLENQYRRRGQEKVFERLKGFLAGERGDETYREVAVELGISEAMVKLTVHRMRRRLRELVRREIAQTVEKDEEVEGEIRFLFEVLQE